MASNVALSWDIVRLRLEAKVVAGFIKGIESGTMVVMSERKRLVFTAITICLVGVVTGLFLGGDLLPSQASGQPYDERAITTETQSFVVHAHGDVSVHEHKITMVVTITETTPHGYFHDFAATMVPDITRGADAVEEVRTANEVWAIANNFVPTELTVPVGTTVTFTNKDFEEHTVTFDNGRLNARLLSRGASVNYTFTQVGTFTYYCDPHYWWMIGKIIVR